MREVTIYIKGEAYHALEEIKFGDETFSDAIIRLVRKRNNVIEI
ncbi:hypothetical protein HY484_02560 [Candidatus Woesearchaeota archaeon]|nr:hypothetical protein [Candidatus Woesearchaeota archaeon]